MSKNKSNQINKLNDCAELIVYDKNLNIQRVLIDIDDIAKVKKYCWHINYRPKRNCYYILSGKNEYLHRVITDCPKGMVVDHINRNTLDNRKNNLRICTQKENGLNRNLQKNNISCCNGVIWNKNQKKWNSRISTVGRSIHLGSFVDISDAINARKEAENLILEKLKA